MAPSLSDPMQELNQMQGDLQCWRVIQEAWAIEGGVMGVHLWTGQRN